MGFIYYKMFGDSPLPAFILGLIVGVLLMVFI